MSGVPIIAYVDDYVIRASHGVSEYYSPPTYSAKARYGVPKGSPDSKLHGDGDASGASRSEWLVGDALDKALIEEGGRESIDVRWPFAKGDGNDDWEGREFILLHLYSLVGLKPSNNTHPLLLIPPGSSSTLPLSEQALYCQMAFENLNVPHLSMMPAPLMALFGMNTTSGVVLHIGRHKSSVNIVSESIVRWECSTSADVGEADCEEALERLLDGDEKLNDQLLKAAETETWSPGQKERIIAEIREFIFAECTGEDIEIPLNKAAPKAIVVASAPEKEEEEFDVAKKLTADAVPAPQANPSHKSKKQLAQIAAAAASKAKADAEAAEAADVITVTIPSLPGKEIVVGSIRHRIAEPLLLGKSSTGDTVWEAVGRAVNSPSLSISERLEIWNGVAVIGDMARFQSFPLAVVSYLGPFLLSSADLPSDTQASRVRLLTIPDYIANFKGSTTDVAPFLGASMVAKSAFSDHFGKLHVSKPDYNSRGPAAIYGVWPE